MPSISYIVGLVFSGLIAYVFWTIKTESRDRKSEMDALEKRIDDHELKIKEVQMISQHQASMMWTEEKMEKMIKQTVKITLFEAGIVSPGK